MWGDQITQTYTFLPHISLAGSLRVTARHRLVFTPRTSWGRIFWYHRPKLCSIAFSPCKRITLLATPHSPSLALQTVLSWHGLTKVAIGQKLNLHLWVLCSGLLTVVYCGLWELRHCHSLAAWLRLSLESDGRVSISGERVMGSCYTSVCSDTERTSAALSVVDSDWFVPCWLKHSVTFELCISVLLL